MAALRRELGLSDYLQLEWLTSSNGMDTLRVVDNFNRSEVGPDWACDPQYWQIVDGELWLTPAAIYEWRYLAVFKPVFNQPGRTITSVSYRWGKNADALGIREGAHALMLDDASASASGYWLWHRNNWNQVWLWIIKNGTWEYYPREGKSVDQEPAHANPVAGDVVTAYIRQEPEAVYFDYYVNNDWDATVEDSTREFPKDNYWYAGVFIHGEQLNNQVDDFTITWVQSDAIPPADVKDLRAIDSTENAVTLQWTATGDNENAGRANSLEIRYATWPITAYNFSTATLVPNPPAPLAAGMTQTFTVTGLQPQTTYYFALRVFDEASNGSGMSNVVEATTTRSAVAQQLSLVSGCSQSGEVGLALAQPLVAMVRDQYGKPFKGHPVQFVVTNGAGTFNGATQDTIATDSSGQAAATLTLGTLPGVVQVEIRAPGLTGSPIACTATARAGKPARLTQASADSQLLSVHSPAAPLRVQVRDRFDNLLAHQPVIFQVVSGAGHFVQGQQRLHKKTVFTDSLGLASATVLTEEVYGDTLRITARPDSAVSDSVKVRFTLFTAKPETMAVVSGDRQSAASATVLPQPLVVRVWDALGAPLRNYPVLFQVVEGNGSLTGWQPRRRVATDSAGYAAVKWTLGSVAGRQRVTASAEFRGQPLASAPLSFVATAIAGAVSPLRSKITLVNGTVVPADSQTAALLRIMLRDDFDNPVAGKLVVISATGGNNYIVQPQKPTDSLGVAFAELRSTSAQRKIVKARVVSDDLILSDSLVVRFIALPASHIAITGGNNQTGRVNQVLAQPVAVRVSDRFGNAVQASRVKFAVVAGGGAVVENSPVSSDSNGVAQAHWRLGPLPGTNRLAASLDSLPSVSVEFIAQGVDSTTGVAENPQVVPQQFTLYQNSPNPCNPATVMQFALPQAAQVVLRIYDLAGRQVRVLLAENLPAGLHRAHWNGRDDTGQLLPSGVYFYVLRARLQDSGEEMSATRKLALIR
ncbi:MAG: Ig-like domain-containing protein [candidate division KSB1 bacterium]|nr:Ig-like domain-containing protein [candidate division KSB1 bacterium]MDZ7306638.1 Ig-like domain-containing protein [candidate division KSB1 bacterium]MDZ7396089.1 Ig-like domain-containing protein [candidate division KSB1 bacterium]